MHRRAFHFASLLLLLASLSSAEAATAREASPRFAAPYVRVLIAQQRAAKAAALYVHPSDEEEVRSIDLPSTSRNAIQTVWSVRSPIDHAAARHAVTGSGL